MTKRRAGRMARLMVGALVVAGLGLQFAGAARKAKPADPPEQEAADGAVSCSMYGDGVLDVMGQSAAYLFIGEHPACTDAGRRQRFCEALQAREGYDTVREHSAAADKAAEVAKTLPDEMRALYLQQHPRRSFDLAFPACGLKPEAVSAKLAAEAAAHIQRGQGNGLDEDLNFLRREAPTWVEAIWTRECAGRVTGRLAGELGMDIEFKGNPVYTTYCKRTTKADKEKAPGRFGG